MKAFLWTALAALLTLPVAHATSASHQDNVSSMQGSIFVETIVTYQVSPSSPYNGHISVDVPKQAKSLVVWLKDGAAPWANFSRRSGSQFDVVTVDLAGPAPANGQPYGVVVTFRVDGSSVTLGLADATAMYTAFLSPGRGQDARVDPAVSLTDIGGGRLHFGQKDVGANTTHTFFFEASPTVTTATSDLSKYVWAIAGAVLGAFLVLFVIRQGWMSAPGRSKKFLKGGAMESRTMLEARRRTLLAGLKELEAAHDAKEVPDDAYAPLKEEYKAQAVRVLRTLEEKKEG